MLPTARRSILAVVLMASWCAAFAAAEVRVPWPVAEVEAPPPFAKACAVEFDGPTSLGEGCPRQVYRERWDGPVLVSENLSGRPIWVTHVHVADDGRVWQSACYRLPPGRAVAIPDQEIRPVQQRGVVVCVLPGPGYPTRGFRQTCSPERRLAEDPFPWRGERRPR